MSSMPAMFREGDRNDERTRSYVSVMTRAARLQLNQLTRLDQLLRHLERATYGTGPHTIHHYEEQLFH